MSEQDGTYTGLTLNFSPSDLVPLHGPVAPVMDIKLTFNKEGDLLGSNVETIGYKYESGLVLAKGDDGSWRFDNVPERTDVDARRYSDKDIEHLLQEASRAIERDAGRMLADRRLK